MPELGLTTNFLGGESERAAVPSSPSCCPSLSIFRPFYSVSSPLSFSFNVLGGRQKITRDVVVQEAMGEEPQGWKTVPSCLEWVPIAGLVECELPQEQGRRSVFIEAPTRLHEGCLLPERRSPAHPLSSSSAKEARRKRVLVQVQNSTDYGQSATRLLLRAFIGICGQYQ